MTQPIAHRLIRRFSAFQNPEFCTAKPCASRRGTSPGSSAALRVFRSISARTGNIFVLVLFLWLLPLVQGCEQNQLSPVASDTVLLAFGDSLTWGTGAKRGEDYPAMLESLLDRRVVNAGKPGETSAEGLARLPLVLEEHRPGLVILAHGGNDFLQRLDTARTRENIEAMVRLIRNAGSEVLLVGVPKPGIFLNPAPFYREIASRFDAPYEADMLSEILSERSLKSDAIHPNAEGYARMARELAEWIALAP